MVNELFFRVKFVILLFSFAGTFWAYDIPSAIGMVDINGGFERGSNSVPEGWTLSNLGCQWVTDVVHGGSYAAKVATTKAEEASFAQSIDVEGNKCIKISAWMRLSQVTAGKELWHTAGIIVTSYGAAGERLGEYELSRNTGTTGWRFYEGYYLLPAEAKTVKIKCIMDTCIGTAWFDDIDIKLLGKYLGNKPSVTPGGSSLRITFPSTASGQVFPKNNNIYYHMNYGKLEELGEMDPSIVRLLPLSNRYNLYYNYTNTGKLNWDLLDTDISGLSKMGAVPFINISWVPDELEASIRNRDYKAWKDFVFSVVDHYSNLYSSQDHNVASWYWNFWNEPMNYRESKYSWVNWDGTENEFDQFYQTTVDAAIKANPNIKIGGCGFSNWYWMRQFINYCGEKGVRMDFLSWHNYGSLPIILQEEANSIRRELSYYDSLSKCELILDEWNSGRDDIDAVLRYGPYAAAYRAASIYYLWKAGVKQIWFISHGPEYGVIHESSKTPAYYSFLMGKMMAGRIIEPTYDSDDPYIGAIASIQDDSSMNIMVWYFKHYLDTSPDIQKSVELQVSNVSGKYERYLIDSANVFTKADSGTIPSGDSYKYTVQLSPGSLTMLKLEHYSGKGLTAPSNLRLE